jgi:hypothetical protein
MPKDPAEQPSIDIDHKYAKMRYSTETWPVLKLPWPDYPQQFAQFVRLFTEDYWESANPRGEVTKIFSRVDIHRLRVVEY